MSPCFGASRQCSQSVSGIMDNIDQRFSFARLFSTPKTLALMLTRFSSEADCIDRYST
ncbi:UNVERIFIED_ORG: uncharacterized protein YfcZ (UPF0381/DUF406 family) [Kosakonia oryzae]|uniref:Uncharacterized protein n=1 Tax=Kosakonia radicincitans TaxID=283686 RepID=A0AAX2EM59_9ENTR|nr:uncharacterized protein YfcZ (UPF0381/DUF406 family) [Kosakonia oryzae]SET10340.1 hypothetical protein SAMN03159294_2563 [Kosakonia radicincitans]SFD93538.1 hypothetical protein SAMN03159468_00449 [Kosakonia radicincitans]SFQ97875.1 hypothetical protein SAMN03159514_00448 [Kosakonia radicincitans]SFT41267.1 hypothetical protein SAMN03159428_00447 [Kosakonia radicincitans]